MNNLFNELADNEQDQCKKDVYLNFAAGNYPTGIQITSGYFSKIYGKKFSKFKISNDPETAKYELQSLLDNFVFKRTTKSSSTSKKKELLEWNEIKRNDMLRQIFVTEYCQNEADERNLTQQQMDKLYGLINVHIFIDLITAENVTITEGKISNIEGLSYINGEYYYDQEDSRDIYTLSSLLQ